VLIYFDQETKIGIFERLAKVVEPDGFMVLGAAESVVGISEAFKPHSERRGLYRPNAFRLARPTIVAATPEPTKAVAMASR
jgi:chemotaxis protein methyltransferase CheR